MILGFVWDLIRNMLSPQDYLNLYGKHRGKTTRTNLIGEGYKLTALGSYVDGGLPAFEGSVYFLSTHKITKEKKSMIGESKRSASQ